MEEVRLGEVGVRTGNQFNRGPDLELCATQGYRDLAVVANMVLAHTGDGKRNDVGFQRIAKRASRLISTPHHDGIPAGLGGRDANLLIWRQGGVVEKVVVS